MIRSRRVYWSALLLSAWSLLIVAPEMVHAQDDVAPLAALRDAVEDRYTVVPVQGGIVLLPQRGLPGVQSIELTNGGIAVNGNPVTGAELGELVPGDAESILRLSYLGDNDRRLLFGIGPVPDAAPAVADAAEPAEEPADDAVAETAVDDIQAADDAADDLAGRRRTTRDRGRETGDVVKVGGSVRVEEDEYVDGDVVAVLGSAYVDGTVAGDVVAVFGSAHLGDRAVVEGDVTAVGGQVHRGTSTVVGGEIQEVSFGDHHVRLDRNFRGPTAFFGGVSGVVSTVIMALALALLAGLAYLLARRPVERMEYRIGRSPWKAALVGLAAQLLFLPALVLCIVVLAISIVGIPLLLVVPFAILGLMLGTLIGFAAVAKYLGNAAENRFGWQHPNAFVSIGIGVGLIVLLAFLGSAVRIGGGPLGVFGGILVGIGTLVQYVVWTTAFGALLLTRFGTRYGWGDDDEQRPPEPPPGSLDAAPLWGADVADDAGGGSEGEAADDDTSAGDTGGDGGLESEPASEDGIDDEPPTAEGSDDDPDDDSDDDSDDEPPRAF